MEEKPDTAQWIQARGTPEDLREEGGLLDLSFVVGDE